MRLGTLLLRDAVIGLSQLEEALRAQILYGGRLGTNLVELGSLDLDTLGLYLAKVHGVPVATPARFEAADPGVLARLGPELAERHLAFPLGPEPLRPDVIAVAMSEPRNAERIDAIQRRLDAAVTTYAAAELRILYYLERHFGIERRPRYLRPAEATPPGGAVLTDRRRTRAHPGQVAPVVRFEPRRRAPGDTLVQAAAPPRISLDDAVRAIEAAEHRDQIGETIIDLAEGRLGAAALFIVRGQFAFGWRGLAADGARLTGAAIEKLSAPLGGSSSMQVAFDTADTFAGASPAAGRPVERQIWDALRVSEPPEEMIVIPIRVGGRVVNLLYGHGAAGRAVSAEHRRELESAAEHAGEGYLRLIQAARIDRLVR